MALRKIVEIDQAKCDGCGQCVTACAEGAIAIRGGKAQLVSEVYCDGLGACLGECPRGAIRILEREAAEFDEEAVRRHLARQAAPRPSACPGSAVRTFPLELAPAARAAAMLEPPSADEHGEPSALGHWPVQLRLVPANAPFLADADLLLVADCVPFALADFHRRFLRGRPVLIACPKLDDAAAQVEKLAQVLRLGGVRSLTVLHMEVPCCTGLVRIAESARRLAESPIAVERVTISTRGKVLGGTVNRASSS